MAKRQVYLLIDTRDGSVACRRADAEEMSLVNMATLENGDFIIETRFFLCNIHYLCACLCLLPVQRKGVGFLTMPPGLGWAVWKSELDSDWTSQMAEYHSHRGHGSQRNCVHKHTYIVSIHYSPKRHTAIMTSIRAGESTLWHTPEVFARVSLLEGRALGVQLSSSCRGGNHHLLISRCMNTSGSS